MNNNFLSTAISGVFDAFRGILTTSRDAACHVSTTTTSFLKRFNIGFLMCGLFCAATIIAHAQSGTVGRLSWSITDDTLTISGTGEMPDFDYTRTPWATHSNSIKNVVIGDGVITIGARAFDSYFELASVTISNSVTSIEDYAFSVCIRLTSVTIPNSVTTIGKNAFGNCNLLTSVTIPNSVTFIGKEAFSSCLALTSINVDNDNTAYSSENGVLFDKAKTTLIQYPSGKEDASYTIPNTVTIIRDNAFFQCNLKSVVIPNSVTIIGDWAFANSGLTSVTIPNSVTIIGEKAFGSEALKEFINHATIPQVIDESVFQAGAEGSENGIYNNANYMTLRVPAGSVAYYRAAEGWKNFKNIVAN